MIPVSSKFIPYSVLLLTTVFYGLFYPVVSVGSEMVLERIDITGNNKTRAVIILQELPFKAGDRVTDEMIEQAAQPVKDLGLFESVEVMSATSPDGGLIVDIVVKEKRYTFILPKLNRNGDGDITTGLVWRSDNLFGLNQRSKFTVAYRKFDDTDEDEETQIKWEYTYPRIPNTPYSLGFVVLDEDTRLEETVDNKTGEYDRNRTLLRLLVGRWLNQTGPSQGLNLQLGPQFEQYDHEYISGDEGLLPDVTIYAIAARVDGYYVHDKLLSRTGRHYGYQLTISDQVIGSDLDFNRHHFFYRKYMPVGSIEHQNLNLQFRVGYINEPILGPPQFKVGGSRAIRGYDRDAIEGNLFVILNFEYLRPIFNRETLRGAVFFDMGDAWVEPSDATFSDLNYGVGFGLRWKLKRFVRTDVRLDIAEGLTNDGETKAYLSTRATF